MVVYRVKALQVKNYWHWLLNEINNQDLIMKLIKLKDVIACTGLGRSTIYKYIEEGGFPKSVSLGCRAVAWVESEVQEWILERIEERDLQNEKAELVAA
jgi:prophage regulatory protein